MNEFLKSFGSLSLALALFPIKQVQNVLAAGERNGHRSPATKAMDSVTQAVLDQLGGTLQATFSALDNVQRGIIGMASYAAWPSGTRSKRREDEYQYDPRSEDGEDVYRRGTEDVYRRGTEDDYAVRSDLYR